MRAVCRAAASASFEKAPLPPALSPQVEISPAENRPMGMPPVRPLPTCTMPKSNAPATAAPSPAMPLLAAADLQDNLMTAAHDLDRLQGLLSHACDELMQGFHGAAG